MVLTQDAVSWVKVEEHEKTLVFDTPRMRLSSVKAVSSAALSLYIYLMFSMYCRRSKKPPPLHTVADWKVVLHLPEIETWLRVTSNRVTQLTHSVGQDSDSRHVDAHLVQLKVKAATLIVYKAPYLCI